MLIVMTPRDCFLLLKKVLGLGFDLVF